MRKGPRAWVPNPIFRELGITERQAVKLIKLYLKDKAYQSTLAKWEKNPNFNQPLIRTEIQRWQRYHSRKMNWMPLIDGHDYPYSLDDVDRMLIARKPIRISDVKAFLRNFDNNMIVKTKETLTIDNGGQLLELILDGV
jgi:hypothetical protein